MEPEVIETERIVEQDEVGNESDEDLIARRAYEIHASGEGDTDLENWLRAERELREERLSRDGD
jgi:hypothetical protein